MILWKKELHKVLCVLISSHEVMKLQSFESSVSDTMLANAQKFYSWFSLHIFVNFMEKDLFTQFDGRFDHFS